MSLQNISDADVRQRDRMIHIKPRGLRLPYSDLRRSVPSKQGGVGHNRRGVHDDATKSIRRRFACAVHPTGKSHVASPMGRVGGNL
jgi:hypothetical protein